MDTQSPQRRTLDEIDAHEARQRERFAHLALIAPTPEMVREIMALQADAEPGPTAMPVEVDQQSVPAGR